jgi:hypothetical protein
MTSPATGRSWCSCPAWVPALMFPMHARRHVQDALCALVAKIEVSRRVRQRLLCRPFGPVEQRAQQPAATLAWHCGHLPPAIADQLDVGADQLERALVSGL